MAIIVLFNPTAGKTCTWTWKSGDCIFSSPKNIMRSSREKQNFIFIPYVNVTKNTGSGESLTYIWYALILTHCVILLKADISPCLVAFKYYDCPFYFTLTHIFIPYAMFIYFISRFSFPFFAHCTSLSSGSGLDLCESGAGGGGGGLFRIQLKGTVLYCIYNCKKIIRGKVVF